MTAFDKSDDQNAAQGARVLAGFSVTAQPAATAAVGGGTTTFEITLTLNGLPAGATVYVTVTAINVAGEGPMAPERSGVPLAPGAPPPSGSGGGGGCGCGPVNLATTGFRGLFGSLLPYLVFLILYVGCRWRGRRWPEGHFWN